MCRKQPTPTDILENPSLTEMDKLVFFYIRPRVRNSDWVITFTHAKKEYVVNMKRWQCIFKASAFSELVNKDVKYFRKSLQRINDFYSKVDIEQKPYWYLISRLYYDDLTRMDNERIMKGEWKDNEGRANKSDNTDETKKDWKEILSKDNTANAEYGNKEINNLIALLKDKCSQQWIIYSADPSERNYAKHLLSKKFSANLIEFWMSMEEFVWNIVKLSTQPYTKQVNNCKKFYYNRWDVINQSKNNMKKEPQTKIFTV